MVYVRKHCLTNSDIYSPSLLTFVFQMNISRFMYCGSTWDTCCFKTPPETGVSWGVFCFLRKNSTSKVNVKDTNSWTWVPSLWHSIFYSHCNTQTRACNHNYAGQSIYGYRCISSDNSVVRLWQTARPQCLWKCLRLETCHYINHNYDTGMCDLGFAKCESLTSMTDSTIHVFGPPRETCAHWGSSHGPGHVLVEGQDWTVLYLARMIKDGTLVVGKYDNPQRRFFANNEGVLVIETNEGIELLTMDLTCTLLWMPYIAGDLLPVGAISGGRLLDGSITYVCKIIQGDHLVFGYYNIESELAYYELGGVHTTTSMEILLLL